MSNYNSNNQPFDNIDLNSINYNGNSQQPPKPGVKQQLKEDDDLIAHYLNFTPTVTTNSNHSNHGTPSLKNDSNNDMSDSLPNYNQQHLQQLQQVYYNNNNNHNNQQQQKQKQQQHYQELPTQSPQSHQQSAQPVFQQSEQDYSSSFSNTGVTSDMNVNTLYPDQSFQQLLEHLANHPSPSFSPNITTPQSNIQTPSDVLSSVNNMTLSGGPVIQVDSFDMLHTNSPGQIKVSDNLDELFGLNSGVGLGASSNSNNNHYLNSSQLQRLSAQQQANPNPISQQSSHPNHFDYQIHQTMFRQTSGQNDFLVGAVAAETTTPTTNTPNNVGAFLSPNTSSNQYFLANSGNSSTDLTNDVSAGNSPYQSAVESIFGDDDARSVYSSYGNPPITSDMLVSPNLDCLTSAPGFNDGLKKSYDNLTALDNSLQQMTEQNSRQTPAINIIGNPEKVAAGTPSLFTPSSTPSNGRSRSASFHEDVQQERLKIKVEDDPIPTSPGMIASPSFNFPDLTGGASLQPTNNELKKSGSSTFLSLPEDPTHNAMRLGRQRRHSQSSSRSSSRSGSRSPSPFPPGSPQSDNDFSDESDVSLSRAKLSELAEPSHANKKTQKNPARYGCDICDKKFTRPYNLKSHLRTHTNERPFLCTICGKAFARQHDRKRHEDLHSGEKKFQCKGTLADGMTYWGCGKRFARTDALRRHFQTESGKECIRPLMEDIALEKKLMLQQRELEERQKKAELEGGPPPTPIDIPTPLRRYSVENAGLGTKVEINTTNVTDFSTLLDQVLTSQTLSVGVATELHSKQPSVPQIQLGVNDGVIGGPVQGPQIF